MDSQYPQKPYIEIALIPYYYVYKIQRFEDKCKEDIFDVTNILSLT